MVENASPVSAEIVRRRLSIIGFLAEEWGCRRVTSRSPNKISKRFYTTPTGLCISSHVSENVRAGDDNGCGTVSLSQGDARRALFKHGVMGLQVQCTKVSELVSMPAEAFRFDGVVTEMGVVCVRKTEKDGTLEMKNRMEPDSPFLKDLAVSAKHLE